MPLFEEADAPLLKTFLIRRLNSASEADPDVLSDYILALLRHDQSPQEVMRTCITQLADFMTSGFFRAHLRANSQIDPEVFVKDVFQALNVPLALHAQAYHTDEIIFTASYRKQKTTSGVKWPVLP